MDPTQVKAWFGQSQATDAQGNPLRLYHGSLGGAFESFSPAHLGSNTGSASAHEGFFFTSNPFLATSYASRGVRDSRRGQRAMSEAEAALESLAGGYVTARKQLLNGELDHDPKIKRRVARLLHQQSLAEDMASRADDPYSANHRLDPRGTLYTVYLRLENPLIHDQEGEPYRDKNFVTLVQEAKATGKDGVIICNTFDPALDGGHYDPNADIYIAFQPDQIKIVEARRGSLRGTDEQTVLDNMAAHAFVHEGRSTWHQPPQADASHYLTAESPSDAQGEELSGPAL